MPEESTVPVPENASSAYPPYRKANPPKRRRRKKARRQSPGLSSVKRPAGY